MKVGKGKWSCCRVRFYEDDGSLNQMSFYSNDEFTDEWVSFLFKEYKIVEVNYKYS